MDKFKVIQSIRCIDSYQEHAMLIKTIFINQRFLNLWSLADSMESKVWCDIGFKNHLLSINEDDKS